ESMQMQMESAFGDSQYGPGAEGRSRDRKAEAGPQREMLSSAAQEELDRALGLVAEVVSEEFGKRFQGTDFGSLLTSVNAPKPAAPARGTGRRPASVPTPAASLGPLSAGLEETLGVIPEAVPMWRPGILYLGQGSSGDMLPLAKQANVDLLIHFDVALKAGRGDSMQNISRCRLMLVSNKKLLGVSKAIDNREAAMLASSGRSDERKYVQDQLANLLAIVDRDIKTTSLPRLSPEMAKGRLAALMSGSSTPSLRKLAEVRLYQSMGLLDDSEVEVAFDIIGGPEALMLLQGPEDERLKMARKWAARSLGAKLDTE
ncbi:MAG: hypothetical protein MI861_28045, partial [Pirellulales bacterium]|nr:hypothetical protein [Pirellulales bacterium]